MENSQRSKLVHFYKKKLVLKATSVVVAMRHWGWSLALASLKLPRRRNSGVFQLCGWGLTFDQYKWTIAHESVGHFDMHVATRAFGYCRHITVKRLNEVSMRSPHQILIWTRRSVGITSEAIIRLKKKRQLRGWVKDFVSVWWWWLDDYMMII